jgi:hypothetical protein
MGTNETLKEVMDAIESKTYSLKRANKSWNIPLSSFFDHLNRKIRFEKVGPCSMFMP